jgi:hypothetical protein
VKLGRICKPGPKKRKQIAQEDFKEWFNSAKGFYDAYELMLEKREYKLAAFINSSNYFLSTSRNAQSAIL